MSEIDLPSPQERQIHYLSPEARRREAKTLRGRVIDTMGPGTRAFEVVKRTLVGTYNDGFIHAGNLAYLAMLAIFPFFILGSALFALIGSKGEESSIIDAIVVAMPPTVANTIAPVAQDAMAARSGWLLWAGAFVALWTVSSLIETIRDILRRAYGTQATHAFWKYRLFSAGFTLAAVILLVLSLFAQVLIGAAQEVIEAYFPQLVDQMGALHLSRVVPTLGLFASLYLLFYTLTPSAYRARRYPKWPGVVFITLWWLAVTSAMPPILRNFFTYSLTYGSIAGIMVALFFFWLVGLGMVIGAELNAALAVTPEEEGADGGGEEACDAA
ncbi:YihY/virulence factor BrkB family protein [Altererythrobacter arenosus]|uniref:YihY/virulence factor BrkB family protein n=1 Tax=Altererythrobacter arenosus TaxID=3032592 RepID=A0ABY8FUQ3_9SPHN|nr:YihY/virulence factor BrkB family protein [Altererythrobacter sp. CAU 1644]WFL78731.1 YihY/virulence factor BrkB family protein [Altererythrobacter sp. CAU 1644]